MSTTWSIARLWRSIREGSTGGEVLSAKAILLLALGWLLYPPPSDPPPGILYRVISLVLPEFWLAVLVAAAVAHLATLGARPEMPSVAVRKGCALLEAIALVLVTTGLYQRGQLASVFFLSTLIALLLIAVFRRSY